jgi:peptidoglycan-associated lipoprotein
MKRIGLLLVLGIFCVTFATGCGSLKKKQKSPEELASLEESAIRGEDIPLEGMPEGNFVEPSDKGINGIFEDVHFDYDKSNVRQQDYPILNKIGDWLKDNEDVSIMIEGHCDERGSNEYNMALGEQRALGTRRYLVGLGIDSGRIYTVSYGEEKPLDPGHTESSWVKNRRAHFLVSK